jgi:imidazolonepropionase-like amidohydrolase
MALEQKITELISATSHLVADGKKNQEAAMSSAQKALAQITALERRVKAIEEAIDKAKTMEELKRMVEKGGA